VENSILYVMPLYLRAASGQLPELKRVIAVFNGKVVMEETLAKSLAALFPVPQGMTADLGEGTPAQKNMSAPAATPGAPMSNAARTALDHYSKAITKLKAGDWAGFGAELDAMKPALEEMNKAKH
jgi:hypothetical protein